MPSHISTPGASSESNAWQELEEVFAGLGRLARSPVAPPDFYRQLLEETVRALHAIGGAAWLRTPQGTFAIASQLRWPVAEFAGDEQARRAHEALLSESASGAPIVTIQPHATDAGGETINPTGQVLLIGSARVATEHGPPSTVAIIEILLGSDASPASYRGCEQFLTAVCELAADYQSFADLRRLRHDDDGRSQLLRFSTHAHQSLNLTETAYTVVNEGRRVTGCDRLSLLAMRGRRCRLLATSGVSRVEPRSSAARRMEELAARVRRADEPAYYTDGECDGLPQVAEAIERHAEESHARQVAAIPLCRPNVSQIESADQTPAQQGRAHEHPLFVLVAEQFDARDGGLQRDRLVEMAEICSPALYNALAMDRLPLGWLLRAVGAMSQQLAAHLPRVLFAGAAVALAVTALVLIPADFTIDAPGLLQPIVRQDVFAPRSGLVDEVLVAHGAAVAAGQPLVRLRDATLELELKRVDGEIETAQRQIDAVRSTRTNRAIRDANPTDAYRLSAEERQLEQRLTNLRDELALLNHERDKLVVASPIAGRVLTWDVGHRLVARTVERGEVLVTVADLSADWQLELSVPDDRIGYVLAAQHELQPDLTVRFRLSSDEREQHTGHVAEISRTADVAAKEGAAPSPTVLVKVALDDADWIEASRSELRPGISARAQILCGRRPLGYVWLHDIWNAALEWLRF